MALIRAAKAGDADHWRDPSRLPLRPFHLLPGPHGRDLCDRDTFPAFRGILQRLHQQRVIWSRGKMYISRNWILTEALRTDYLWRGLGRGWAEQEVGSKPRPREQSPALAEAVGPSPGAVGLPAGRRLSVVGGTLRDPPQPKQVPDCPAGHTQGSRVMPPGCAGLDQLLRPEAPAQPPPAAPLFSTVSLRPQLPCFSLKSL